MSYQVLARKWRPKNFAEVVGQEHVLRALINALDNNRLHHAYLFTGTRGVGKTTLGRILAKSLNCEHGISSTPCGQCSACTEIDEGRFVDLLEVDAASRTKVEDTRDMLENVQYAPSRGRFKVYLIDEVHMLSNHSFNALLKTLEEPPPHVKFLLATTDPQKLPVTILSRCLKFNLKFIPVDRIQAHLAYVMDQENVPFDDSALSLVAKSAAGSMRDALSLLDQAIAHGDGSVREYEVQAMLGTLNRDEVVGVLQALAQQDGAALLEEINRLAQFGVDFSTILTEVLSLLHHLALVQISGADDEEAAAIVQLAQDISPEDVQLYYQIATQGLRDLPIVPDSRAGFEMIALRMLAFKPATQPISAVTSSAPSVVERAESVASDNAPRQSQPRQGAVVAQHQTPVQESPQVSPTQEPKDSRQAARANLKAMLGQRPDKPAISTESAASSSSLNAGQAESVVKNTDTESVVAPVNESSVSEFMSTAPVGNRYDADNSVNELSPPPVMDDSPPPGLSEPPPIEPESAVDNVAVYTRPVVDEPAKVSEPPVKRARPQSWSEVVAALPLNGMAKQVAANSVVSKREGNNIYLTIKESHSQMAGPAAMQRLEEALSEFYNRPLKVHLEAGNIEQETPAQQQEREIQERLDDAVDRFSKDPAVQVMKNTFDAEIDPDSVKLTD